MDGGSNVLANESTGRLFIGVDASLAREIALSAERYFARWLFECERRDESWEPDNEDFAYELGLLMDMENPAQNAALLKEFAYAFNAQLEHNGYPRVTTSC